LLLDEALLGLHLNVLGEVRMANIAEEFRQTVKLTESQLNKAMQVTDLFEVSEKSHKLAGAAETMGVQQLAKVLKNMEIAANEGRIVDVECLYSSLHKTSSQTLSTLDTFLEVHT